MSIRRTVTPAMRAANRANASKSAGPTSERGKDIARFNAGKHWGRAEAMRELMPALGEDPAEFAKLREGLYRSLGPGDEFEALLVDDMADIHWRLRRMVRGETAAQAQKRREGKAKREELDAADENGTLRGPERALAPLVGFVGLPDSPAKFYRVLETLKALALFVRHGGFPGEGVAYFQGVYGPNPGVRGKELIADYRRYHEEQESADAARQETNRAAFLRDLEAEIAWFEKRAASDRQARAELAAPRVEAELINTRLDLDQVMLYQERLERRFEKKWKLLMRYRRGREAEEEREAELVAASGDTGVAEAETEVASQEMAAVAPPSPAAVAGETHPSSDEETPASSSGENAKMNERTRQPDENNSIPFLEEGRSRQHAEKERLNRRSRQHADKQGDKLNRRPPTPASSG